MIVASDRNAEILRRRETSRDFQGRLTGVLRAVFYFSTCIGEICTENFWRDPRSVLLKKTCYFTSLRCSAFLPSAKTQARTPVKSATLARESTPPARMSPLVSARVGPCSSPSSVGKSGSKIPLPIIATPMDPTPTVDKRSAEKPAARPHSLDFI